MAPKRHPGCHATCEDYASDLEEYHEQMDYLKPHIADIYTISNCDQTAEVARKRHRKFQQNVGGGFGHK